MIDVVPERFWHNARWLRTAEEGLRQNVIGLSDPSKRRPPPPVGEPWRELHFAADLELPGFAHLDALGRGLDEDEGPRIDDGPARGGRPEQPYELPANSRASVQWCLRYGTALRIRSCAAGAGYRPSSCST